MTIVRKDKKVLAEIQLYKSESDNSKKWEVTIDDNVKFYNAEQYSILDLIEKVKSLK